LDRTDSIELRQDGCLARRHESHARKDGSQDRGQYEKSEALQDTLISRMDIHQARTGAMQEKMDANLKEEIKASKEEMKEEIKSGQAQMKPTVSAILEEMEAWLEKTEAMDMEANPEEIQSEMEHQRSLMKRLQ
jgi:hypothetical protein